MDLNIEFPYKNTHSEFCTQENMYNPKQTHMSRSLMCSMSKTSTSSL